MVRLHETYKSAFDSYIQGGRYVPNVLQTKFKETRRMTVTVSPESNWNKRISLTKSPDDGLLGYTNLRLTGIPKDIEYIELEISYGRFQKVYPSDDGEFRPFRVFDLAVPIPPGVTVDFILSVTKETALTFEWDVVTFLDFDPEARHEMLYKSICRYEKNPIKKGNNHVYPGHNQFVEELTLLTDDPVKSVEIQFEKSTHSLYVPYKGMHNGKHMYRYVFESPLYFDCPGIVFLNIESDTDTVARVFTTNQNILVVWKGMIGIHFSK